MVRFEEPWYLLGILIALTIVPFLTYYHKRQLEQFSKFASPDLLPGYSEKTRRRKLTENLLILLAIMLVSISLANPQWSTTKTTLNNSKTDIFIVLDVSRSMTAEDIKPSRLDKSKQFLYRLLDQLKSNRIGLILFAGRAYLQMPLTEDLGAVNSFINGADPDMIPTQGTAIGASIDLAMRMFNLESQSGKMIVVVSDGEDHDENAVEKAKIAKESGAEVITIGVGTSEGGTMPVYNVGIKDVKKDENGEPIITKLNKSAMKEIAEAGGGMYFNATDGETAISKIKSITSGEKSMNLKKHHYTDYESFFQWFLAPALLILILLFFRNRAFILIKKQSRNQKNSALLYLLAIICTSMNLNAQESLNSARNGDKLYKEGKYAEAEQKYTSALKKTPDNNSLVYNKSNCQYQQKNYSEAEKAYDKVIRSKADIDLKTKAYYNQGNTHFNQQKYSNAIQDYRNSLKIKPDDVEAKKNLSIALLKHKQQQQKENQKEDKNKKDPKEKQKDNKQNSNDNQKQSPKQQQKSKEEAERLLKIIENEEKNVMKKLPKQRAQDNVNEKDW